MHSILPSAKFLHKLGSILNESELVYGTLLKSVHQQWQWHEFFNHQAWEMTWISRWSPLVMFVIRVWIRRLLILPANEFWHLKNTSFITDVCCHQNTIIITHEPLIRNSAVKNAARSSPAAPPPPQHHKSPVSQVWVWGGAGSWGLIGFWSAPKLF